MITRSVSVRETLTRWHWAHKEEGTRVGEKDIVPDGEKPTIIGQAVPHRQLLIKQVGKGVGPATQEGMRGHKTTLCGTNSLLSSVLRDAAHVRVWVSAQVCTASLRVLG